MLQFNRLTLSNFGAYKETETVDFPAGGVTVVYGENMRGKTTLLNAFRFALFGKVLTRGLRQLPCRDLVNWESAAAGNHQAKVTLTFVFQGQAYELTRIITARPHVNKPYLDSDYHQEWFLQKDDSVLSEAQAKHEMAQIMPDEISRFFLFDGELLQQYEELLRQESTMGKDIADAIERILGVPVLKNARSTLDVLVEEAQTAEGAAARANQKTMNLANAYAQLQAERQTLSEEQKRYEADLLKQQQRVAGAEEVLKNNDWAASLLDERKRLLNEVSEVEGKLEERLEALKMEMGSAWKWVVAPPVTAALSRIRKQLAQSKSVHIERLANKKWLDMLEKSLAVDECQACGQGLNNLAVQRVVAEMKAAQASVPLADAEEMERLARQDEALKPFQGPDRVAIVEMLRSEVDSLRVEISQKRSRIDEISSAEITDVDEQAITDARQEWKMALKEIGIIEEHLKTVKEEIQKRDTDIAKVQNQLAAVGTNDDRLHREQVKRHLFQRLHKLFDAGITTYRQRLRGQVEKDASDLFLAMTSEHDYAGLKINEYYGLTIVHRDGSTVPVRSSGAEHVVALSLMGALQRNAPMRGPVVMDSPFGRLDDKHKNNIVKALPILADQVMLLVFDAELNAEKARPLLAERLKAEYVLERISARHTRIRMA